MKNERRKGFLMGVSAAVLVMGLGFHAVAAGRTIPVNDDIRLAINGAQFTPVNVNGTAVEVFEYNGTTYAPIRAICEAVGLTIDYDDDTRTARITKADAGTPDQYIGETAAKNKAAAHAGVTLPSQTRCKLKWDDGRAVYDIEFTVGTTEYDYEIDALTGDIREYDVDRDDRDDDRDDAPPAADNLITASAAQQIALKKAPGATVVTCKLDDDDGRWVYEIELRAGNVEYDCEIDAVTGAVLDWDVDYDD